MIPTVAPRSLFQQRVNDIMKNDIEIKDSFFNIFKLSYLQKISELNANSKNQDIDNNILSLCKVLDAIGVENFAKLIASVNGNTITFPSEEEYQNAIYTTLHYYYTEVIISKDRPSDIVEKLGLKQDKKKYSIIMKKSAELKKFINSGIIKMFNYTKEV